MAAATNVKAHIYKVNDYAPYPWVYEVDFLDANGKRDTSIDSLDYGSLATFEEALDASYQVIKGAER